MNLNMILGWIVIIVGMYVLISITKFYVNTIEAFQKWSFKKFRGEEKYYLLYPEERPTKKQKLDEVCRKICLIVEYKLKNAKLIRFSTTIDNFKFIAQRYDDGIVVQCYENDEMIIMKTTSDELRLYCEYDSHYETLEELRKKLNRV